MFIVEVYDASAGQLSVRIRRPRGKLTWYLMNGIGIESRV